MPSDSIESSHFSPDTREFIALLHRHRVRYVVVGGEAVIFHGHARLTGDVDFFFEQSEDNARALFRVLMDFWRGAVPGIAEWRELLEPGIILQYGVPPNRIDLLGAVSGLDFSDAWETRQTVALDSSPGIEGVFMHFLSLPNLVKNKEAAARPKDLDDLRYLRRAISPD